MKGVKDQQIQLRATASSSRGRKLGRQPVPSSWSWLARVDTSPARLGASCCRPRWQETRWEQPPSVILIIGDQKQAETSLETSIHSYQAPSYRQILSVQDMRMFPAEHGDHALVLAQPSNQQIAPIITSNMLAELTSGMDLISKFLSSSFPR